MDVNLSQCLGMDAAQQHGTLNIYSEKNFNEGVMKIEDNVCTLKEEK